MKPGDPADLQAELDALEQEVMAIADQALPQAFGVAQPLARLLRILRAMQARIEALEARGAGASGE